MGIQKALMWMVAGWVACAVGLAEPVTRRAAAQDAVERRLPPLYLADIDHSTLAFKVLHVGITRVPGVFEDWTAALTYHAEDPTRSSVSVVIDVGSLDTNSARRDNDLRSENFFDVAAYPKAVFQSTGVRETSSGWIMDGMLRIRERSRPVSIEVASLGAFVSSTGRSERVGFEGSVTVERADFGVVNEGNVLERLGVIGKEATIEIQLSGIRFRHEAGRYRDSAERRSVGALLEEILDERGLAAALERYRSILDEGDEAYETGVAELIILGNRLVGRDRAEDAARILELYVERNPGDLDGRFWLGEMLAESGADERALEQYRAVLAADPHRVDAVERIRHLTGATGRAELVEKAG